ncbi:MAG TPA: ABC transporter ATP-binding protein [Phycisphaerae bacterium]|nr:ABC transporter ATP-binding protein [Phycisphaerae bacterium]
MTDKSPINLSHVAKSYGRSKQVLMDATLAIPEGSVVGLLGTNGSGKTTLIKCALGLLKPQSGECRLLGEPSWNLSAAAKTRIGYVPQIPVLFKWAKVGQLISYTSSFYPRWNRELVETLLKTWSLSANARIYPLSSGELQKLAIILAMGHEPDLLILDEPAASLDPMTRRGFLRLIIDIAEPGKRTVLFSTHIISDLERVADSAAILKDGRIVYHGLIDDLKDQVKRLHVVARRALPERLDIPGTLHEKINGTEAFVSVRDSTSELVSQTADRLQANVDVEPLNLEDIFLEMHHV